MLPYTDFLLMLANKPHDSVRQAFSLFCHFVDNPGAVRGQSISIDDLFGKAQAIPNAAIPQTTSQTGTAFKR